MAAATKQSDIKRSWHLIDLKDKILGRAAVDMAQKLMGKNKVSFTPNVDGGDYVVVINASGVKVTGGKEKKKIYFRHSGYPGGEAKRTLAEQLELDSRKVVELAVKGMLPKNKLRDQRMRRLKVFKGAEHKYDDKFKAE